MKNPAGSQIFTNYGSFDNEYLLHMFGFAIRGNPCDFVQLDHGRVYENGIGGLLDAVRKHYASGKDHDGTGKCGLAVYGRDEGEMDLRRLIFDDDILSDIGTPISTQIEDRALKHVYAAIESNMHDLKACADHDNEAVAIYAARQVDISLNALERVRALQKS